jgi:hypothetical protein
MSLCHCCTKISCESHIALLSVEHVTVIILPFQMMSQDFSYSMPFQLNEVYV